MQKSDLFSVWLPYTDWECWKHGMWANRRPKKVNITSAALVLSAPDRCEDAMRSALQRFKRSALHHLTKFGNRRPWVGQAACLDACGATEEETRLAWCVVLTEAQREVANAKADLVIAEWERHHA